MFSRLLATVPGTKCVHHLPWIWIEPLARIVMMQFRLTYRGALPANGDRREKQGIRRSFHPQLKELWRQEPLKGLADTPHELFSDTPTPGNVSLIFRVGQFRFVPLVTRRLQLVCRMDTLFLRRAAPGALIKHGGDIDNRLKTLFDALRVPTDVGELPPDDVPTQDEDPFFCLLEDDALLTAVSVDTDRLLEPGPADEVALVITVETRPVIVTWNNIGLA